MKKLLLIISVSLFSFFSFSQEALIYTNVIKIDSTSKSELYNRASIWAANTFNSAKDVIQLKDADNGIILIKAIIPYVPGYLSSSGQTKGIIKYTFKLYFKEGRYKYEITNFIHVPDGNQYGEINFGFITTDEECPHTVKAPKGWKKKAWNDLKTQIDLNIQPLIKSLTTNMLKPTENNDESW